MLWLISITKRKQWISVLGLGKHEQNLSRKTSPKHLCARDESKCILSSNLQISHFKVGNLLK
jgi:hypothetical protein